MPVATSTILAASAIASAGFTGYSAVRQQRNAKLASQRAQREKDRQVKIAQDEQMRKQKATLAVGNRITARSRARNRGYSSLFGDDSVGSL